MQLKTKEAIACVNRSKSKNKYMHSDGVENIENSLIELEKTLMWLRNAITTTARALNH